MEPFRKNNGRGYRHVHPHCDSHTTIVPKLAPYKSAHRILALPSMLSECCP